MQTHYIDSMRFTPVSYTNKSVVDLTAGLTRTNDNNAGTGSIVSWASIAAAKYKYIFNEEKSFVSVHFDIRSFAAGKNVYFNDDTNRMISFLSLSGQFSWMNQIFGPNIVGVGDTWNNVNLYLNAGVNNNICIAIINGRSFYIPTINNIPLITSVVIGNLSGGNASMQLKNLYIRGNALTDGDFAQQCPVYMRINPLYTVGNNTTGWVASSGNNWQAVTDANTTTFVSTTGIAKDLYNFADAPNHIYISGVLDSLLHSGAVSSVISLGSEYTWPASSNAVAWSAAWYSGHPSGGTWAKNHLDDYVGGQTT